MGKPHLCGLHPDDNSLLSVSCFITILNFTIYLEMIRVSFETQVQIY